MKFAYHLALRRDSLVDKSTSLEQSVDEPALTMELTVLLMDETLGADKRLLFVVTTVC